jgi:PHD/YefM family antitoxin component YafN of YafNO toxin-antitoxin module
MTGQPPSCSAAVLLSLEDLESLEETVGVLSDPGLVATIAEADAGRTTRLSQQEALAEIER